MDINRDFPFSVNGDDSDCLSTVAGRIIYKLFTQNDFQASLTFHGGDNVIGYPWGAYSRSWRKDSGGYVGLTSPDVNSFVGVGKLMRAAAKVTYEPQSSRTSIRDYVLGDMSSTVYPVNGGMEDWAYGASWDDQNNGVA